MDFHVGWPQVAWFVLATLALVNEIIRHGKPKEGRHDAVMFVIYLIPSVLLLYWGGFFSKQ